MQNLFLSLCSLLTETELASISSSNLFRNTPDVQKPSFQFAPFITNKQPATAEVAAGIVPQTTQDGVTGMQKLTFTNVYILGARLTAHA